MSIADQNERDVFAFAHQLKSDEEREVYLKEACAGRPELLERVRTLFEASAIEDGRNNGSHYSYGHIDHYPSSAWEVGKKLDRRFELQGVYAAFLSRRLC